MQLICISPPAYNRGHMPTKRCATHGTETANCDPYCSPIMDGPPPRRRRIVDVKAAAVGGMAEREAEQGRPVIDGGTDDDPATPE